METKAEWLERHVWTLQLSFEKLMEEAPDIAYEFVRWAQETVNDGKNANAAGNGQGTN